MLLVDWGDRDPDWGRSLTAWRAAVAQKRHGRRSCSPSRRGRGEAANGGLVTQRLETGLACGLQRGASAQPSQLDLQASHHGRCPKRREGIKRRSQVSRRAGLHAPSATNLGGQQPLAVSIRVLQERVEIGVGDGLAQVNA